MKNHKLRFRSTIDIRSQSWWRRLCQSGYGQYIALISIITTIVPSTVAEGGASNSHIPTNVIELVTNCPPINDLVFKYEFGNDAELCQFRSQSNGFFARISRADSIRGEFALQDTECGRWNDDYWYYIYHAPPGTNAPPVPLILYKYHFNSNDVASAAYQSVNRYFLTRLRLFTSLGIAGDSAQGSWVVQNKNEITYKILRQHLLINADLTYSQSLPVRATLRIVTPDGRTHIQSISYRYKSDIAEGRIPAYISGVGFSIEVIQLTFGQFDKPLPKNYFMPPESLLAARGLLTEIHSNRVEYTFAPDGRLLSRDSDYQADRILSSQIARKALQSGLRFNEVNSPSNLVIGRFFIMTIFAISTIGLILLIILKSRKSTNKKTEHSNKKDMI